MEEFQKLGELIEKRWRLENYNEQLFPEIAAQALTEADLPARVDPWDIIRWVQTAPTIPAQHDVEGKFGEPPITLFAGPRFNIDVYYWLDGTTSIHQHAFSGAFQVLLGSSIHSDYDFETTQKISEHLSIGELSLNDVQILQRGDIGKIVPGSEYIHSLFHLDRPSATITVRTVHTPSASPQYNYRPPYFGVNPFFSNAVLTKKLQTVSLLLGAKHRDADVMIGDLIASSDFHTAFFVLLQISNLRNNQMDELFGLSTGKDRFNAILERAKEVHGVFVDSIVPVLDEQDRQQNIIFRRGSITSEEHRFFLALLLNVSNRERVLELVRQRFPETDPVEKILDWVEELSTTRVLGSKEPNALGIEGFSDGHMFVIECLLRGYSPEEAHTKAKDRLGEDYAQIVKPGIDELYRSIPQTPLFRNLV